MMLHLHIYSNTNKSFFHRPELGENFSRSYCSIKKYTYLCNRKREKVP